MQKVLKNSYVKTILSGVLYLGAFYLPYAWPIIFVALVPFFKGLRKAQGRVEAFFLGTLLGAFITGGTSFWYFSSTPISSEIGPVLNFVLILAAWVAMVVALSPVLGLGALLIHSISARTEIATFAAPFVWVLFEFLRMYAFLFVTFAPGVENPAFYSTGFIGYPLADSESLLQIASVGGIYGLSFLVVGVNSLFFYFSHFSLKRAVRYFGGLGLTLLFASLLPVVAWRAEACSNCSVTSSRIGIMSVSISEEYLGEGYKARPEFTEKIRENVRALAEQGAELILLPEGSRFLVEGKNNSLESTVVIDVVAQKTLYEGVENVAFEGTVDGGIVAPVRAKSILTPQGEYIIGLTHVIARIFGYEAYVKDISSRIGVRTATWGRAVILPQSGITASVVFCIEIIAPWFGADIARRENSDVLLVAISQGRFKNPYSLNVDTLRFLKVRAVEAGKPLLSSADHARAYALDKYGRALIVLGEAGESGSSVFEIKTETETP